MRLPPPRVADLGTRLRSAILALFAVMAAFVLVAMTLLTSVDVIARYVFNSPLKGAFELTQIKLASLVYISFVIAAGSNEHVRVELLDLSKFRLIDWLRRLGVIALSLFIPFILGWQIWSHGDKFYRFGQVTNSLSISLAWVAYFAAACCFLTLIVLGLRLKQAWREC